MTRGAFAVGALEQALGFEFSSVLRLTEPRSVCIPNRYSNSTKDIAIKLTFHVPQPGPGLCEGEAEAPAGSITGWHEAVRLFFRF